MNLLHYSVVTHLLHTYAYGPYSVQKMHANVQPKVKGTSVESDKSKGVVHRQNWITTQSVPPAT